MSRLPGIIARNARPRGLAASIGMAWRGVVILLLLGLLVFTDWALTDPTDEPPLPSARERSLERVHLLREPAAPRAPASSP